METPPDDARPIGLSEPFVTALDRAREVLSEAGYSWDDDGRLLLPAE